MQIQSITDKYIDNVPWVKNPALCFTNNGNVYEAAFRSVIQFVPNADNHINFADDVWDFRPLFENINCDYYVLRFGLADKTYKDFLKFFVLYKITKRTKLSTIGSEVGYFIQIINGIKKNTNHDIFSLITSDDISNFIENKNISSSSKSTLYESAFMVYDFIIKNYGYEYPVNLKLLKERANFHRKNSKQNHNKIPDIPKDYYNDIVNKAIEILNDDTAQFNMRMTAGLIILASQSGLRTQDLLGIKVTDLKETILPVSNVKCFFLHYQTRKPSKGYSNLLEFDIYASILFVETFTKMCEIRKQCEFCYNPYLYVLNRTPGSKNTYPINPKSFHNNYRKFYYSYLNIQASKSWEGIKPVKHRIKNATVPLHIPSLMQFRVHLATSLYNNGISLIYIQRYLGHLTEMMLGYYVRPKDRSQENAEYTERIVKKIVCDDGTPIGLMGKELKSNLISFIEKGNYNVATDTQQILDDLGENLVIREKGPGLCCIKTSIIPCKNDARTNATLCAFGMCPNIFHFYDAVDVSYRTLHNLEESYALNLERGFTRAAEKELRKLKDFIERRFKPELNELNRLVNKHGLEAFCCEHPDLRDVATKIDDIYKEVELWENY